MALAQKKLGDYISDMASLTLRSDRPLHELICKYKRRKNQTSYCIPRERAGEREAIFEDHFGEIILFSIITVGLGTPTSL
jgi:hypothetical protein